VSLESPLLLSESDVSLSTILVQSVDSLLKRLVCLWTNQQWHFAQNQFVRTKQTESKGNGQSVWSKMDRECSNVTHDSATQAVRFFSCGANHVDNVVLSLGYISQTHAINEHTLTHCQLTSFVTPGTPIVVSFVNSFLHTFVESSWHGRCGFLLLHQSKIMSVNAVKKPKWPFVLSKWVRKKRKVSFCQANA